MTTYEKNYLHGYSREEEDRLIRQSEFLEASVFKKIDFKNQTHVIEVGCGVGAQLKILGQRFPHLHLTGVDHSTTQIARAEQTLAFIKERVRLQQADGSLLPFADKSFDGAFLCWVLEHVPEPVNLLKELRRVLKHGGVLFVTEVFNCSLFTSPKGLALLRFWEVFNRFQEELGGHPNIGGHLGNFLTTAEFSSIATYPVQLQMDRRLPCPVQRAEFMNYWREVFLSVVPQLQAVGRLDEDLVQAMLLDLQKIEADPDGIFYVTAIQARAMH
jgi:ubiquinone/menaquinone biosynthesis C-methylase UbiE